MTESEEPIESKRIRVTKWFARHLVGSGTTYVVGKSASTLLTPETKTQKALVYAGSWGIGGLVSKQTEEYTDAYIDELVTGWREAKKARLEAIEKAKEELDQE